MKLLVTGGAGFIGSNFVRFALTRWRDCQVVVLDKLTYAGNLDNLGDVLDDDRCQFIKGDICDPEAVGRAISHRTHVVNFAAETHVDRSILSSGDFVRTDVEGTRVLLEACRKANIERYLQVSTDEVYGDIPAPHHAREDDPIHPRSPYAASKAAGDLLVAAYHATYGLPTLITRGANTYGPYQYPEKIVPLFVTNALQRLPLPLYGDGRQMRDWLYVGDHCRGIAEVLERGDVGDTYNLGAGEERTNLEVSEMIVTLTGADPGLVTRVADRPGHDRRYALDISKVRNLGWRTKTNFTEGLERTVVWYRSNQDWWKRARGDEFQRYYDAQYGARLAEAHA